MKINISILTTAFVLSLGHSASAAIVATYWKTEHTTAAPLGAHDYLDGVTASSFDRHGSVTFVAGGNGSFTGWTTTLDDPGYPNYAGFTVEAEDGFQMTLTSLELSTGVVRNGTVTQPITSYRWGYRVDSGAGYGDWVFNSKIYTPADGSSFWFTGNLKTWDFEDFTTSGKVEFGVFATMSAPAQLIFSGSNPMNLNGTVSAVPEPSAALLGALGGLALLRRRR